MGRVIRVVLRFREPFWRSLRPGPHGTANMTFLFASAQPLPTWWTAWPSPAPLITGWAAGPKAQNLPADTAQLEAIALSSLASAVNLPELRIRGLLQACYFHDWQADPFARGAYSYVKVGGAQSAQAQLAQPLANRLFFAGEATCSDGHHATVHGAIASGARAAGEVMRLRRVSRA
jgi:monoamine oxidase